MSIKSKLIISYLLLIVFSISILGFLIGNKSRDTVFHEVTEKSERIAELIENMVSVRNELLSEKVYTDLNFMEKTLKDLGEIKIDDTEKIQIGGYDLPSLYAGNTNLSSDTALIDDIEKSLGAIATVFLLKDEELIRIGTNITLYGRNGAGTSITNDCPIYENIIQNKPYYGKFLFGKDWYITGYKPLLDKNGKVVGAFGFGYKELNPYLEKTLNDIKIGETGYVYIMNSKGDVLVHPNIKGGNLSDFNFSKEIIENKNGVLEYEFNNVYKLAAYRYFEPWDWYIVTTANYDDLKSSSISILKTTLFTGLGVFLLGALMALFLANTLVKPINKLKKFMEIAGRGDLTVHSDINSNDEIGVLSNSFNTMIKENRRLLEEIIKHDHLKTEFFSNISHELKTPLNIIYGTTQLFSLYLRDDVKCIDTEKINTHIDVIRQNCYRLIKLINNLIDITKIDSGFIKLNLKNRNVVEIIESITLSAAQYVQSKSRTLLFDTDVEEKIMAIDLEMMERIILNLISNAIKFTAPGDQIEVNLYDKGNSILISVKDTGIGIPENKQEEIFERFKQVDPLLSRRHEGSGIGLSLVKSLVEIHEGNISVKSKLGEGTEFLIELPVKIVSEEHYSQSLDNFTHHVNVEKIQIEFSDIYG